MLIDFACSSQMNGEVNNHPPDVKKAKMKVKQVVLPIEETFTQQLPKNRISTYMEQEVLLTKQLIPLRKRSLFKCAISILLINKKIGKYTFSLLVMFKYKKYT